MDAPDDSRCMQRIRAHMALEGELATHGLSFSNLPKWGFNPKGQWLPLGVWFYPLVPHCDFTRGYASERTFANIGKLPEGRVLTLWPGHPADFSEDALEKSLNAIQSHTSIPVVVSREPRVVTEGYHRRFNVLYRFLTETLAVMGRPKSALFNRLLHVAGYDVVVDYGCMSLHVEPCQGVQTWPKSRLVETIEIPPQYRPGKYLFDDMEGLKAMFQKAREFGGSC